MDRSNDLVLRVATVGFEANERPLTRRHVVLHDGASRGSTIDFHSFLTLFPPFLPFEPFALALLSKNGLQVLSSATSILRVGGVLERPWGR